MENQAANSTAPDFISDEAVRLEFWGLHEAEVEGSSMVDLWADSGLNLSLGSGANEEIISLPVTSEMGPDGENEFGRWHGWMARTGRWAVHVRSRRLGEGLSLDCRLLNLTNQVEAWQWGISLAGNTFGLEGEERGWLVSGSGASFMIHLDGAALSAPMAHGLGALLPIQEGLIGLEPRQCLEFEIFILKGRADIGRFHAGQDLVILEQENGMTLVPFLEKMGVTISLLDPTSQEISAQFDLQPGVPIPIDFAKVGGRPQRVAAISEGGVVISQFDMAATPDRFPLNPLFGWPVLPNASEPKQGAERKQKHRVAAAAESARACFQVQDWGNAALYAEQELLFNGNDALAWWELAVAQRHGEKDPADALSNAHFLAPLMPCLRAEAVLSGNWRDSELHPMLKTLADRPEIMVLAACTYLERALWKDAASWLNECVRASDHPRLHLLVAFAYLKGTSMRTHAAEHYQQYQKSKQADLVTEMERMALSTLQQEFGV